MANTKYYNPQLQIQPFPRLGSGHISIEEIYGQGTN